MLKKHLRNRRGFTLILMMFLIVVLMACAAMAVDASLMYAYRGQLTRTADATALAGVIALGNGAGVGSVDTARHYAFLNPVGTNTATLANADVEPGTWNGTTFTPTSSDWTTGNPFAVRTTTRYTGLYSPFARYFGFNSKNLTATAVAVRGSVATETCVRPWAVSYQSLLDQLGGALPITHDLTAADVAQLHNATVANNITMNATGTDGAPRQSRAIQLGPGEYATAQFNGSPNGPSAAVYRAMISEPCASLDARIGSRGVSVDDWLVPTNGQMKGPTGQGIDDLLCGTGTCLPAVRVNVAIWDTYGNSPHGYCSSCFHVKYMGVFYVTGWNGPPNNQVTGYFSSLGTDATGFVAKPGPITKNALVF